MSRPFLNQLFMCGTREVRLDNPLRIKGVIVIGVLCICCVKGMAQGNFSPYSQFGIGDLDENYYNRTSGLANTGLAYRSNRFLINNNPAALSALTNQYLVVEMGIRGSLINYYGQPVNPTSNQSGDITFRKLSLGIKLSKHWGSSIGLTPFATQNYEFNVPADLGTISGQTANNFFSGHGSVNKVYWANSYDLFNHISIGIDAGYLFGQLNQKNTLQNFIAGPTLISTTNNISLSNLYMRYGLQLYGKIGKHWEYSVGGTFSPRTDLFAEATRQSLNSDSVPVANETLSRSYQPIPMSYGAGISLTRNQKYTFLADYKHEDWGSIKQQMTNGYAFINSDKASAGFEISKKKILYNSRVEVSYFQAGMYYGDTYLQVYGQPIRDMGATLGFGINTVKNPLSPFAYNIVLQYGVRGTQANNLIQEKYTNVTFIINYGTVLYTKGRKYD
jgi:hypothetical protein